MTSKQTTFMINLIMKNYHRHVAVHIFGITLILGGFAFMLATSMSSAYAWFIITGSLISIATGLLLILLNDGPFGLRNLTPRGIKEEQLKVLKQHAEVDFKDLIHSVPLKEYFKA